MYAHPGQCTPKENKNKTRQHMMPCAPICGSAIGRILPSTGMTSTRPRYDNRCPQQQSFNTNDSLDELPIRGAPFAVHLISIHLGSNRPPGQAGPLPWDLERGRFSVVDASWKGATATRSSRRHATRARRNGGEAHNRKGTIFCATSRVDHPAR